MTGEKSTKISRGRKTMGGGMLSHGWLCCLVLLVATFSLEPVITQTSTANKSTLVLLDNLAIKETHSTFFRKLQGTYKRFI